MYKYKYTYLCIAITYIITHLYILAIDIPIMSHSMVIFRVPLHTLRSHLVNLIQGSRQDGQGRTDHQDRNDLRSDITDEVFTSTDCLYSKNK